MTSPSGIKTWLPEELKKQEAIINSLVKVFEQHDYQPIEIPTLVDISVIQKANRRFNADIFKVVDRDGKTLALRTELTQPIAKTIATRAQEINFPARIFYNSSVFRYRGIATDDSREIRQVGVEFFDNRNASAKNYLNADLEIIKILLESLSGLGLKNFKISITDAKIWHKIFQLYGNQEANSIYESVLKCDLIEFKKLTAQKPIKALLTAKCLEDIEKALDLDLSNLAEILKLGDNIVFDPLQCPDIQLYTGLHINVIVQGEGKLVAIGGRYDNLCSEFGTDLSAIGFAFYIPRLLSALNSQTNSSKKLRIAIAKGALYEGAKTYLSSKGFIIPETEKRKLIIPVKTQSESGFDEIEILMVRGHDVPTYVDHGAADLGIVGYDVILDSVNDIFQLEDLDYGHCRLCVCAKKGSYKSIADMPAYTRVATTFPKITRDFFAKKGLEIEVINLYGSVELGPLTDLSDVIVDLVATGKTLDENGLEVVQEILPCTARLIANHASFKNYKDLLNKLFA